MLLVAPPTAFKLAPAAAKAAAADDDEDEDGDDATTLLAPDAAAEGRVANTGILLLLTAPCPTEDPCCVDEYIAADDEEGEGASMEDEVVVPLFNKLT